MYKRNPRDPNFEVVKDTAQYMIVRDLGPWDVHRSITNGAEEVVAELFATRKLGAKRLGYYDSEGELGELVHDGCGNFVEFGPVFKIEGHA